MGIAVSHEPVDDGFEERSEGVYKCAGESVCDYGDFCVYSGEFSCHVSVHCGVTVDEKGVH